MKEKRDMSTMMKDVESHGRAAAQGMADLTRTVLMSGVGMAGLALDEAKAFLDKLVEQGEIAEKDARNLMTDLTQRSKDRAEQALAETERQVIDALGRLGVPSKNDVAELSAKVSLLVTKLDELIASRAAKAAASAPQTIIPPQAPAAPASSTVPPGSGEG
jgi:polyhydroxyalkanoate synthesis regulator phasin